MLGPAVDNDACKCVQCGAGKAGVALSTLGPGATNMTTSAAYAQLGGFPTLLITGAAPPSWPASSHGRAVCLLFLGNPSRPRESDPVNKQCCLMPSRLLCAQLWCLMQGRMRLHITKNDMLFMLPEGGY